MLISVIIPTYNRAQYLEKTIMSVINQTYKNVEAVIIDDGSNDNTNLLVEKLMQKYEERIQYYYQSNRGVAYARNVGIQKARGEFISFLDSDDIIHEDKIKKQITKILETQKPVCYCGFAYLDLDLKLQKRTIEFKEGDIVLNYLKNKTTPDTNCWLIKKSLVLESKLCFREKCSWGEDMEFFVKLISRSEVCCVPEFLSYYRKHNDGSLSNFSWDKLEKDYYIWTEVLKWIQASVSDSQVNADATQIIEGYRIPALLIYNLYNGLQITKDVDQAKRHFFMYKKPIQKISFCNGLRSLKLLGVLLFLKMKLARFITVR